jgi:hypothetical protein
MVLEHPLVDDAGNPPVRDLRPLTPSPSRKRPPLAAESAAAVIAVVVARRAGICITALPTAMVRVLAASVARTVTTSNA